MKTKRQNVIALVLAAGKGTRMGAGHKPKVLHEIAGKPMLEHILETLWSLSLDNYALVLDETWQEFLPLVEKFKGVRVCHQKVRNGTGGAVAACAELFKGVSPISYADGALVVGEAVDPAESSTLICYGDTPLLTAELLKDFMNHHESNKSDLTVLGMKHPEPTGYGRLILNSDKKYLSSIVEEKDATEEQRKITLCNSGILLAKTTLLFDLLRQLENDNSQQEYYLTDIVGLAQERASVCAFVTENWQTLTGVNTQKQLKEAEAIFASSQHL